MRWLVVAALLGGCTLNAPDSGAAPEQELADRFVEAKPAGAATAGPEQGDEWRRGETPESFTRFIESEQQAQGEDQGAVHHWQNGAAPGHAGRGRVAGLDGRQAAGSGERADKASAFEGKANAALAKRELTLESSGFRDASKAVGGQLAGVKSGRKKDQNQDLKAGAFQVDLLTTGDTQARDRPGRPRANLAVDLLASNFEPAQVAEQRPATFLPRTFYFENTYLGGNAAYAERLRRLDADFGGRQQAYRLARLPEQAFDPPVDAGIKLSAALDRRWIDKPGKVYLQVGLQGSERYGWRRPPLDLALVVDGPVIAQDVELVVQAVRQLLRGLGPQDRLGVYVAGRAVGVLAEVGPLRDTRTQLMRHLESLTAPDAGGPQALADAIRAAGKGLRDAAEGTARVPGTQTVLILTQGTEPARVSAAGQAAHALALQGAVTSVIDVGGHSGAWWQTASAGNGNYYQAPQAGSRMDKRALADAVDAELAALARVVGRLLRVNVRLAPNVHAVRVLGSRPLDQREVRQVKDREEATDRHLSRTLGVTADRGDDDDGIQTVIPYFYGGDEHVILLELWVEGPGPVAEVSLKYKDMVRLENATARAGATLASLPRPATPGQAMVRRNQRGFYLAEALQVASWKAGRGDSAGALNVLRRARGLASGADVALIDGLVDLVERGNAALSQRALAMARDRRVGTSTN